MKTKQIAPSTKYNESECPPDQNTNGCSKNGLKMNITKALSTSQ